MSKTEDNSNERRLCFNDGRSNKFWHIILDGTAHTVHYGKVGSQGQQSQKTFACEQAAQASFEKLLKAKLSKGYVDESAATVATDTENTASRSTNALPADLADGESCEMQGSGRKPYVLKNIGGVYSCTCPAWANQSLPIEQRTCKHLRRLRGDAAEKTRLGGALPSRARKSKSAIANKDSAPLLLAHTWTPEIAIDGWWLSEKLDGVRAYWDGKRLLSRQGNEFHAPDWFIAPLPSATPLDGELWMDRKCFQQTVSIVRRQDKSEHWRNIRYRLFDAPTEPGGFEARLQRLTTLFPPDNDGFIHALEHLLCKNAEHLQSELERIEQLGGEGLMLRQPGSAYEIGRSTTLLKVKRFLDGEARVIDHIPGKGKHKGRLGALLVELEEGTQFSIGTGLSDKERSSPPAVGTLISFRYQEVSNAGVPRFPSYIGVYHAL